jgi:hypothetical protein
MNYTVNIWKHVTSSAPELSAEFEADDPLEAAFSFMRRAGLRFAFYIWVTRDTDGSTAGEYTEVECPDREVC